MYEPTNFKIYDKNTVKRVNQGMGSYVRVNIKGTIVFSQMASDYLELKEKDKIIFAQDNDRPHDWYIRKDKDGLTCRKFNNKTFGFSSVYLATKILQSLNTGEKSLAINIGNEPNEIRGEKWHALITKGINGKK